MKTIHLWYRKGEHYGTPCYFVSSEYTDERAYMGTLQEIKTNFRQRFGDNIIWHEFKN